MRMEIRNLGTPLYVIDGVMKDEGQFNNLDVNDIESISILKTDLQLFMELRQLMGLFWLQQKGER